MRWFLMALGLFFVLGLAAGCTPAYEIYCPQGYDTASRCHKSGDRDRGDHGSHGGESEGGDTNAGRGNGSEGSPDGDPGNSEGHNNGGD